MPNSSEEILKKVEAYESQMVKTMAEMIAIPAISPKSGGEGEGKRATFLENLLKSWGFSVKKYEYTDDTGTKRPNLISKYGKEKKTIWVIAHMDTVAVGDLSSWNDRPIQG